MSPVVKTLIEHSTDDELVLGLREHEELSGVVVVGDRLLEDHHRLLVDAMHRSSAEAVVVRPPEPTFTEALAEILGSDPEIPLERILDVEHHEKRKFGSSKSDARHSELRAKRKAERQARKKNRRNR